MKKIIFAFILIFNTTSFGAETYLLCNGEFVNHENRNFLKSIELFFDEENKSFGMTHNICNIPDYKYKTKLDISKTKIAYECNAKTARVNIKQNINISRNSGKFDSSTFSKSQTNSEDIIYSEIGTGLCSIAKQKF
jgi:hypothetical protein